MSGPSTSQYFENCHEANFENDLNKNVTCDQVATVATANEMVKSKYFKIKKSSLTPWITNPTNIKTKSLSEKIKCISEGLHPSNILVAPTSQIETVSSINSESETTTNTDLQNVITSNSKNDLKSTKTVEHLPNSTKKAKKKRFDGVPEAEILHMTLPDLIRPHLDLLIVGINPGLETAYRKHYYAGPGNHFWQCMSLGGILPTVMTAEDDASLLDVGIGFTNVVERTTRGQADLTKKELVEGCVKLKEKIVEFKPKIVAFNGKYIFEVFSGNNKFSLGLQPGVIAEGIDAFQFVMPSSSARCSHLPRAQDKVPFFKGLKKMLDLVRGDIDKVDDEDVKFPVKLTTAKKRTNQQSKS